MQQKTKIYSLVVILIVIIAGSIYLIQINKSKNGSSVQKPQTNQTASGQDQQTNQKPAEFTNTKEIASTEIKPESIKEVSGKVLSFNAKALYIQLAEGKGLAINIKLQTQDTSGTPVAIQGSTQPGSLVDLKPGQDVTVKIDNANNAIQISIKK